MQCLQEEVNGPLSRNREEKEEEEGRREEGGEKRGSHAYCHDVYYTNQ